MAKEMTWNEFVSEFKPIEFDRQSGTGYKFHTIGKYLTREKNWPHEHINSVHLFIKTLLTPPSSNPFFELEYLEHYDNSFIITRKPLTFSSSFDYYTINLDESKVIHIYQFIKSQYA